MKKKQELAFAGTYDGTELKTFSKSPRGLIDVKAFNRKSKRALPKIRKDESSDYKQKHSETNRAAEKKEQTKKLALRKAVNLSRRLNRISNGKKK